MEINDNLKNVELLHNIVLEVEFKKVKYKERYKKELESCIECNIINILGEYDDQKYISNYSDLLEFLEYNTYYKWYKYNYRVIIRNGLIIVDIIELKY